MVEIVGDIHNWVWLLDPPSQQTPSPTNKLPCTPPTYLVISHPLLMEVSINSLPRLTKFVYLLEPQKCRPRRR